MFSEKDKEGVSNESKALSIALIIQCSKDQRKGFDSTSDPLEMELNDDGDMSPRQSKSLEWETQIELLMLAHQQISQIKNLELFINLRKLNLMDNNITKVQGLESCKLLEELSLEKNKITQIENLGHLKYLKKLDLGQN